MACGRLPQVPEKRGLSGPIIEDIVTNWTLEESKLMRLCPVCGHGTRESFDLKDEMAVKKAECPNCGFPFPYLDSTPDNFALFKD